MSQNHNHEHSISHDDDVGALNKSKIINLIIGVLLLAISLILRELFPKVIYHLPAFILSYLVLGGDVVLGALKNIRHGKLFDENFLMSIATIGAFAIGEFPEAVAVMLFYQIGEHFQDAAIQKSKRSIKSLMKIRPDYANLKRGSEIKKVSPYEIKIGDLIVVKPGEKIPLDGIVIDGESMLDTTALTGESLPRNVNKDDEVLSGCINQNGVLTVKVTKKFGESAASKIIELVKNALNKKSQSEKFITTFSTYYTPIVVGLAILLATIPPILFGASWAEWINRSLIFLVVSCPCALVISIPLSFFGGIGAASKRGILIKGSNYLEAINKIDIVIFDKTGTLTKGVFDVIKTEPHGNFTKALLLEHAAKAEAFSNHPIALSIMKAYGEKIDKDSLENYEEISGHGIKVKSGEDIILAGNENLMSLYNIPFIKNDEIGTKVYVAINGMFAGVIIIADEIKSDSKKAIEELKENGVRKLVMFTGDNEEIGKSISSKLDLDEYYAQMLPADKVEKLEMLYKEKIERKKLVFVGDGINDAPVLARADIGIAMGALGSDAAIEAADIVFMTDEPSKLVETIKISRKTKKIVWQNIVISISVKILIMTLGAFGIATMWEAVFADVGVALIAILNSMRLLNNKDM